MRANVNAILHVCSLFEHTGSFQIPLSVSNGDQEEFARILLMNFLFAKARLYSSRRCPMDLDADELREEIHSIFHPEPIIGSEGEE